MLSIKVFFPPSIPSCHAEERMQDQARQEVLEAMNLSFLRLDDLDVKQNMAFVLGEIYRFVEEWENKSP
ncbi:DUF559 domain-containing protein [Ekhidna sp.]|uniref:DUF559 domain-containing protein n=1 Tax=Ekhidna sp. TaxID=2608089 RepID=UPI003C7D10CA